MKSKIEVCGGICYWLAGVFLFIIIQLILLSDEFVKWADAHSGLASWYQAIFSVLAIIGAGLFPIIHNQINDNNLKKTKFRKSLIIYMNYRDELGRSKFEINNFMINYRKEKLPENTDQDYVQRFYDALMSAIHCVDIGSEDLFLLDSTSPEATAKIIKYTSFISRFKSLVRREFRTDGKYYLNDIIETIDIFLAVKKQLSNDLDAGMKIFDEYCRDDGLLLKIAKNK